MTVRVDCHPILDHQMGHRVMLAMNVARLIDLLNEYGFAKFGDEWWPGNAGPWIGDDKGGELAALLDSVPNPTCGEAAGPDQPTA